MYRVVTLTFFVTLGLIVGCSSQHGSNVAANPGVLDVTPGLPSAAPIPSPEPAVAAAPAPMIESQPVAFSAPTAAPVQQAVNISPAPAATPAVTVAPAASAGGKSYTVKKGDTLFSISKSQLGSGGQWKKIVAANPGLTPQTLRAGQKIAMP